MKQQTFDLIKSVNRAGLDNSSWGLCQAVENTATYFGSSECVRLHGMYLYIWREDSDTPAVDCKPDFTLHVPNGETDAADSLVDLFAL